MEKIENIRKVCGARNARIGIITPYAAQARLINRIVKDWTDSGQAPGLDDAVKASTVHRFQGGEEPIIIFDSCEAGIMIARMLDDTQNGAAKLVLNVAMTRAERRMYFVGDTKHLLRSLPRDSCLSKIVQRFVQEAQIFDSADLVDSYYTTDFERYARAELSSDIDEKEPISGELFTEKTFWNLFLQDLKSVKSRLIIVSPFVTVQRASRLMDFLRAIIRRGIEVRIFTKPIEQQTGKMAEQAEIVLEQLRTIGAHVFERRKTHEKMAIIDDTTVWEGSLNILSHRDTREQMRRLQGPSVVEDVIKNLELVEERPVGMYTDEICPGSRLSPHCDGRLVVRIKFGRKFLGCSNYPKCKYTSPINAPAGRETGKPMRKRKSRR
jgi:hypothetical protein